MLNKKGFTLMEIMTAMAIIAIISVPILQVFVTSHRVGRYGYDTDKANTVAVKTVEEIRQNPSIIYDATEFAQNPLDPNLFTKTDCYASDWAEIYLPEDAEFQAEITVTKLDSASIDSSYIPELIFGSGIDAGTPYVINMQYGDFPTGSPYTINASLDSGNYIITCYNNGGYTSNILSTSGTLTYSSVSVPVEDCISGLIPIVLDNAGNKENSNLPVSVKVSNTSGTEVAFYIYDDYNEPHNVTAEPLSGTISINYMMQEGSSLVNFDELEVNVLVKRQDGSVIADYTTMVYLAG